MPKPGIKLLLQGEPKGSYTKILQGPNEAYTDFLARLETVISCSVIGEDARSQPEKLHLMKMKIKNVKEYHSIHETETLIDYLKACHNLGSKTENANVS